MKKYASVFKASFKQESKTLTNTITLTIAFVIMIYIFKMLWDFIYGKSGAGSVINGYSLNNMIWYLIMAEILTYSVNPKDATKAFGDDIKSGKIAYQLNKPYNYYCYQITNQAATYVWKLMFLLPTGLILGLCLLHSIPNFSALYILPILLSLVLAVFLTSIIYGTIGLLTFWIEEATPFTWIVQKFQMLLGLFFPPEFFPVWVQGIINFSPIYGMISGPCKLLASFSWDIFLKTTISQVINIAIFLMIGAVLYKFGTRKVNIHGG